MSAVGEWLAKKLDIPEAAGATAVQIVFALAVREMTRVFSPLSFEEEPITSALTGVLASHATWVISVLHRSQETTARLFWSHYRKTLKNEDAEGRNERISSESISGADFALLVRVGKDDALLALFQSKIARKRTPKFDDEEIGFDLYQRSKLPAEKDVYWRPSQLVALVAYANELRKRLVLRGSYQEHGRPIWEQLEPYGMNQSATTLTWVHYLAYRPDKMPDCVPLSVLQDRYVVQKTHGKQTLQQRKEGREVEKFKSDSYLMLELLDRGKGEIRDFLDLLDLSKLTWQERTNLANAASGRAAPVLNGWLSVSYEQAKRFLPLVNELSYGEMRVYVVDETSSGGPRLELNPEGAEVDVLEDVTYDPVIENPLDGFVDEFMPGNNFTPDPSAPKSAAEATPTASPPKKTF